MAKFARKGKEPKKQNGSQNAKSERNAMIAKKCERWTICKI